MTNSQQPEAKPISIAESLARVRAEIEAACRHCQRAPQDVRLLAVSKTQPLAAIETAMTAGQQEFGENYLQEAAAKVDALPGASWHFIGAIQSNKTRDIASRFDWVHSVASARVARRLSEQRPAGKQPINVLVQVNISGEQQKSGVDPGDTATLVSDMLAHDRIRVRGLMAIPAPAASEAQQHLPFAALRELRDEIARAHGLADFDQLSMGMSADFRVAIEQGATWIRIGTAIFGPRPEKQQQAN